MFKWTCPVCNSNNEGDHPYLDICELCDWQDDHLQRDNPTYDGGANDLSLNEYKTWWDKTKRKPH